MNNNNEENTLIERLSNWMMDNLAGPLGTFANYKIMVIIREGLISIMPIILVGSVFLLLSILGSPAIGSSGEPLLPFLEPYSGHLGLVNNLTMGFMSLYGAIAFSYVFAREYELNQITLSLLGAVSFLLITINAVEDGMITVGSMGAAGLFVAMLSSIVSGYIYKFLIDRNIYIKMPEGVPPAVGNAFSALIPFAVSFFFAWTIRTMLGIDLTMLFTQIFGPIFSAADNVFVFTIRVFITMTFWSVGIHGDNILGGVIDPVKLQWIAENTAAAQNGIALNELPNIWTTGLERSVMYTSAMWGLMFWMIISKRKNHKTLAIASLPSAAVAIIEPIVFGTPIVMSPLLMIPWIVSGTVSGFIGYLFMQIGWTNRFFIELPWATPPPILAVAGTGGDYRNLLLVLISFVIGVIVYAPFFKALERKEIQEEIKLEQEHN